MTRNESPHLASLRARVSVSVTVDDDDDDDDIDGNDAVVVMSPRARAVSDAARALARNVPNLEGSRVRLVDARGEIVGRLASRLARALQGKDKPTYSRDGSSGDVVVVVNAGEVALTGKKLREKRYHRHTGYVGGLVTRTASEMFDRDPTWVLRKAVERMLPRCVRSKEMMRKLRVFPGEEHGLDETRLVRMEAPPRALKKAPNARIPEGMTPFNPEAFARRVALANRSEEAKSTFARRAALAAERAENRS